MIAEDIKDLSSGNYECHNVQSFSPANSFQMFQSGENWTNRRTFHVASMAETELCLISVDVLRS